MYTYTLSTQALPETCRALTAAAIGIASEDIADEEILFNFKLALFESLSNVALHAYKGREAGKAVVELTVAPGQYLETKVMDQGKGFEQWPVDIKNVPPDSEKGRGLFLISKLVDAFEIRKEGDSTVHYFKIQVKEEQWTNCA